MKRKILKLAATGALMFLMAGTLAGCGKKEIDVMAGVELEFSGVDGYGTVRITDEYVFEDAALEAAGLMEKMNSDKDGDAIGALQGGYTIEEAVKYEISPTENLSNGDVVTVTASVNNESVEKYKIQFTGSEKKFTVEGLKEVEQIDLFEYVDVEFQGIAPYVRAMLKAENNTFGVSVNYSIDRNDNLAVGDTVIMTAEYDEQRLLENGYMAGENTKEFVVPECDQYITELSQIPDDTLGKMQKQIEDAVMVAREGTVTGMEYIGSYFLTAKGGMGSRHANIIYLIFRTERTDKKNPDETFSYYEYGKFEDLMLLKDGICSVDLSDYEITKGRVYMAVTGDVFYRGNEWYCGFDNLDTLFNKYVTKNIEDYEYESSVAGE